MKTELITIIVFTILLAVALILIVIYRTKLFKKTQGNKTKSLQQGYGFYSDPIILPCNSSDGKCTSESTEKVTFKCIPNPSTGKGCINDDGVMSYDHKISERPCQIQCVRTLFDIQDATELSTITTNNEQQQVLTGIGCNKVVNVRNGFDETDFFIGEFDSSTRKYALNNCIPDDYRGYYQRVYTCTNHDPSGANNCRYSCGQDATIRQDGIFDTKLSKNVLMYYPTEFDEEGVKRHVCYDINDVNQVEILNSTTDVPEDFVYPNKCYKHTNEFKSVDLNSLYPVGTSNIINKSDSYNNIQGRFFIDLDTFNNIANTNIINTNYDYYNDYVNYIKLNINNEIMLVKNFEIYNNPVDTSQTASIDKNIINSDTNIITYFIQDNLNIIGYYIELQGRLKSSGNLVTLTTYDTRVIENNEDYYLPFELDNLLGSKQTSKNIAFGLSTTTINFPADAILEAGDYIYYQGVESNYNLGNLVKVLSVDNGVSTAVVDAILTDRIEKINWYKYLGTTEFYISFPDQDIPVNHYDINLENLVITNNIFYDNLNIPNNNQLKVTRDINSTNENFISFAYDPYYILDQSSGNDGFYYPLYTRDITNLKSYKNNNGTSWYWLDVADQFNNGTFKNNVELDYTQQRTNRLLLNDIENEAFYLTGTGSNNEPIYYYPVYINNSINTLPFGLSNYGDTVFYVASVSDKGANLNPPPDRLKYLFYDQYAVTAMGVNTDQGIYNYPVFLNNLVTNTHTHKFVNYPDLTFYMPSLLRSHAQNEPPSQNYKMTDFSDVFNLGSVNISGSNNYLFNAQLTQTMMINLTTKGNSEYNETNYLDTLNLRNEKNEKLATLFWDIRNYSSNNDKGVIMSVIRNGNKILDFDSSNNKFINKNKLYKQLLSNQVIKSINNEKYNIIINPERNVILEADYTLFRSPLLKKPDGTLTSICYDEYNKPLPRGTNFATSRGDQIIVNIPCSNFNTDINSQCGVFGLSIAPRPCTQEREDIILRFNDNTEAINVYDDYFNIDGEMENGLDIQDNRMYCLENFNKPYDSEKQIKCFPPYFTQENIADKIYAPGEELYVTKFKRDYYISLVEDNNNNPLNPIYWQRIFNPTPDSQVVNYQTFLYQEVSNKIFRVSQSGVTGIEPNYLAIQPVYRKNKIPYFDVTEFMPSTLSDYPTPSYQFAKGLNNDKANNVYPIYNYNLISGVSGANNSSTFTNPGASTLIDQNIIISYQDEDIATMKLQKGDIFQVSTSFFNSLFLNLASTYRGTVTGKNDVLDDISIQFTKQQFNSNLDNNIITCNILSPKIKVGDYLYIIPYSEGSTLDNLLDPQLYQDDIINTNMANNIYNPTFEIVLVTAIDTDNKKVTTKRNIFNLTLDNYCYNGVLNTNLYSAIPFASQLLNTNFVISDIENNKLSFELNLKIPFLYINFVTDNLLSWLNYTPYICANYIKKSVSVPNKKLDNKNIRAYLASKPKDNKVISALLDILPVTERGIKQFYINEFRNKRYTVQDDFETTFEAGDTISIENNLELTVINKNIFYQDKQYDYLCYYQTGQTELDKLLNTQTYLLKNSQYYMPYVSFGIFFSLILDGISASPRPGNETITMFDNTTKPIGGICFFPYETYPGSTNNFSNVLGSQKALEEGNNIAYIKLKGTTFTNGNSKIVLDNIEVNGKPEGIRYLAKSDITDGTLNREGFGCITDFNIRNYTFNSPEQESMQFTANNGYTLRLTSQNIASYDYIGGNISSLANNIPNYDENDTYNFNNVVDFINPNQRIYYRNDTEGDSEFDINTWEERADTIYNDSSIIDFAPNESYYINTNVNYNNKLWKALKTNFNVTPGTDSKTWKEVNLTENLLTSKKDFFFTYSEVGTNDVTPQEIALFNERNINNYPMCINDITEGINYCSQQAIKFKTNAAFDFSNSFINVLPGASAMQNIMGKTFLTKQGNNYLTLPAVPYTAANYKNAKFLKDSGEEPSADTLAQYIYQIPIENALDEGKPFCTGDYIDTGVSDVVFANSIIFFMLPLGLEYQDYPSYGVSYNGTVLTRNFITNREDSRGISIINTDTSGGLSFLNTTIYNATNIISQPPNINAGNTFTMTKSDNSSVKLNVTITEVGYSPFDNNTAGGSNYANGEIWYYKDTNNKIIAHGVVMTEDGALNQSSFITYQVDNSQPYGTSANFGVISQNGINYNYSNAGNKIILDFKAELATGSDNFEEGNYNTSDNKLVIYFAKGYDDQILQYGELGLCVAATPQGSIKDGTSAYQVFNTDSFKCRMYGLFGSDYLAKVSYQLDDLLINNNNQENPGLIFDIYTNDILSNTSQTYDLVSDDVNAPKKYDNFYNVFTIKSLDGTSSNINLLTNSYNKPISNPESVPLLGAYSTSKQLRNFNIVNTTDVHNLFSIPYNNFTNEYLPGDITENLPVFSSGPNNTIINFSLLRQNRNKNIPKKSLDCSFFFEPQGVDFVYPSGGEYNLNYNERNNKYTYRLNSENTNFSFNNNINLFVNREYTFNITNISTVLQFSRQTGSLFPGNIITAEKTTIGAYQLTINYYINGVLLDYKQFNNPVFYENKGVERIIKIFYNTELNPLPTTPPVVIYSGFNNTSVSSNSITFIDNS